MNLFTQIFTSWYVSERQNGAARSPKFVTEQVFPVENNVVYFSLIGLFTGFTLLAIYSLFKSKSNG